MYLNQHGFSTHISDFDLYHMIYSYAVSFSNFAISSSYIKSNVLSFCHGSNYYCPVLFMLPVVDNCDSNLFPITKSLHKFFFRELCAAVDFISFRCLYFLQSIIFYFSKILKLVLASFPIILRTNIIISSTLICVTAPAISFSISITTFDLKVSYQSDSHYIDLES